MAGLLGIRDPRMQGRYPGGVPRETIGIPPRGVRESLPAPMQSGSAGLMGGSMSTPQGGMAGGMSTGGYQSPSQGLFQAYMQQLFNQKYAPPVIPGSPGSVQQFNGYRGFGSPMMPMAQPQQQQQPTNPGGFTPTPGGPSIPWYLYNQA